MACTEAEFLGQFCEQSGFTAESEARFWMKSVLGTLGTQLTDEEIEVLEHRLPDGLGHALRRPAQGPRLSEDEFYERLSEVTRSDLLEARQRASAFFSLFSACIGDGLCVRLQQYLPQLSSLFDAHPSAA